MRTGLQGLRWLFVQFLISFQFSVFSYSLPRTLSPQEPQSSLVQDHWKLYRGNGSFVFTLHSSSFLLPKQIYLYSEMNSPANCAFYWLSSVKGLFEPCGSFEGKTEKSEPPSFIPLGTPQKLHCQNECFLLSLLTYWLCVKFFGGFICQSAHILHDFHVKSILGLFKCLFGLFSWNIVFLATLFSWHGKEGNNICFPYNETDIY